MTSSNSTPQVAPASSARAPGCYAHHAAPGSVVAERLLELEGGEPQGCQGQGAQQAPRQHHHPQRQLQPQEVAQHALQNGRVLCTEPSHHSILRPSTLRNLLATRCWAAGQGATGPQKMAELPRFMARACQGRPCKAM